MFILWPVAASARSGPASGVIDFWFAVLVFGPLLYATAIIHVLFQAVATKALGGSTNDFVIWPLGGFRYCGDVGGNMNNDAIKTLAGPLSHIPMAAAWLVAHMAIAEGKIELNDYGSVGPNQNFGTAFTAAMFVINLSIFFISLIPVQPLPGGRILVDLLIANGWNEQRSARACVLIAAPMTAALMAVAATLIATNNGGWFHLLSSVWIAFEVAILWRQTRNLKVMDNPIFALLKVRRGVPDRLGLVQGDTDAEEKIAKRSDEKYAGGGEIGSDWEIRTDEGNGSVYYVNKRTGEMQWERPGVV